jgi:membrane peptidoglycan carboxypeptidase
MRRPPSPTTVFVRLTLDLGASNVAKTAHAMGVESPLRPVATIGLGVNPASPLEMASAYATVAARGVYHTPYAISSVSFRGGHTDRGWKPRGARHVLPADVADEVTRVLEGVIAHGTGTAADLGRPAAGKTGTTSSLADAWFDGYTPDLAAVVWVGYPSARVPMRHVHGIKVYGGTFPAQIWRKFMTVASRDHRAVRFLQGGATIHWRRWCGRFQYARSYANARPSDGCTTRTTTRRKTTRAKTTTTVRRTTTIQAATTAPTTTAPPRATTTTAPPPTTTTPTTTTEPTTTPTTTTTPTPTTTTPATTTGG